MKKRFLIIAVITMSLALAWSVSAYFFQVAIVQGRSMEPSIRHLTPVLIDKRAADFCPGEIVAFHCEGLSAVLFKRVAGIPGDRVLIKDGTLYRNGEPSTLYPEGAFTDAGILGEETELANDEYVVIGDNIAESKDSRDPDVGCVKENDMIGRLCYTFW